MFILIIILNIIDSNAFRSTQLLVMDVDCNETCFITASKCITTHNDFTKTLNKSALIVGHFSRDVVISYVILKTVPFVFVISRRTRCKHFTGSKRL